MMDGELSPASNASGSGANGDLPPGPTTPILDWSELDVHAWFASLGFPYYESQVEEHGLTGEILVHVDHEALKDIGIHSVGQRLAILKGVYTLKLRDDVPIEESHWVPPSDDMELIIADSPSGVIPPRKVFEMLGERDERIRTLEFEVKRLSSSLEGYRDELSSIARAFYGKESLLSRSRSARSPTSAAFSSAATNGHAHSASLGVNGISRGQPIMTIGRSNSGDGQNGVEMPKSAYESPLNSPRHLIPPGGDPRAQHSIALHDGNTLFSSLSASHGANISLDATTPSTPTAGTPTTATSTQDGSNSPHPSSTTTASSERMIRSSEVTLVDPIRSSTASDVTLVDAPVGNSNARQGGLASSSASKSSTVIDPFSPTSPSTGKGGISGNPLSSFKVTLEDPCYKVLPAALRKYKINDDWRLYALFLCYGQNSTTERCLALDDRPLLLFQKLKESDMNPVFMLRHIKDIRSPMSIAATKHATRRERRAREAEAEKTITATTPGLAEAVEAAANAASGSTPTTSEGRMEERPTRASEVASLATPSPTGTQTFGVAVYPYFAERPDELHVQLRDVFEVQSKAKGWWRVRRHRSSPARSATAEPDANADLTEGWVPSGCLVEVSTLPPEGTKPDEPKSIVHAPGSLLSQHVFGPALLDYKPAGDGELRLTKGEILAVYKRYSSWSYVVRSDGTKSEGGWAPAWMVGRGSKDSKTAAAQAGT